MRITPIFIGTFTRKLLDVMDGSLRQQSPERTIFIPLVSLIVLLMLWTRVNFNSHPGQMDEYGYLFVGKWLLSGEIWPTYSYIFGSNFNWYLLGLGDLQLGGLKGARILAGLFGVVSLLGMYLFSFQLFRTHTVAIYTCVLLALQSTHVFISQLATYDILSFMWLVFALGTLLWATQRPHHSIAGLVLGSFLLFIAISSKYVTLMYFPLVIVSLAFRSIKSALIVLVVSGLMLLVYGASNVDQLLVLYENQLKKVHDNNANSLSIASIAYPFIVIPYLSSIFVAFFYYFRRKEYSGEFIAKIVLCLIMSTPVLIYHLHSQNMIALYKHVVFVNLFLLPIVALGLSSLANTLLVRPRAKLLVPILILAYGTVNYLQLIHLKSEYPDVSDVVSLTSSPDLTFESVLSEDAYLFRYLMLNKLDQDQIAESGWLDNDLDGIKSTQDVKDALWDRKFKLVYLNDQIHPGENDTYRKILSMRGYREIYTSDYSFNGTISSNRVGLQTLYLRNEESLSNTEFTRNDIEGLSGESGD